MLQRFKPMDEVENTVVELLQHVKVKGFLFFFGEAVKPSITRIIQKHLLT